MTNKKLGNDFESQLCESLSEQGFWCHLFSQNQAGQPADVIAVRNGKAHLIDCKVCSNGKFALSRMEENQDLSMELWKSCGNGEGWFALRVGNYTFMLPHSTIRTLRNVQPTMSETEIHEYGTSIDEWSEKCM